MLFSFFEGKSTELTRKVHTNCRFINDLRNINTKVSLKPFQRLAGCRGVGVRWTPLRQQQHRPNRQVRPESLLGGLGGNALQKNSRYRFYPVTAVCYAVIQLSLPCTANSALRASILRIRFSPSSASERNSAMVFFICGSAFDL